MWWGDRGLGAVGPSSDGQCNIYNNPEGVRHDHESEDGVTHAGLRDLPLWAIGVTRLGYHGTEAIREMQPL